MVTVRSEHAHSNAILRLSLWPLLSRPPTPGHTTHHLSHGTESSHSPGFPKGGPGDTANGASPSSTWMVSPKQTDRRLCSAPFSQENNLLVRSVYQTPGDSKSKFNNLHRPVGHTLTSWKRQLQSKLYPADIRPGCQLHVPRSPCASARHYRLWGQVAWPCFTQTMARAL